MKRFLLSSVLGIVLSILAGGPRASADEFVHVCTDAGAGAYEAFPDVCRLQDGRLMCVFYAGYGHVALPNEKLPKGGRISFCTSSDEGKTWSAAGTLYDGPDDDRDPSIAQLKSGRLICNFFTLKKSADGKKPWEGTGSWYITSDDAGKTWTAPVQLAAGDYYTSAPVRELTKDLLMVGLYRATDAGANGAITRWNLQEGDKATWEKPIDIDGGNYRLDA
ncbi:MAG: sialidase family protein, partial [Planctomycetaceae bacterium]